MKYILKNLKALIKNEGMIFMLMIVCIISSSLIINFSYGLYQNYNVIKNESKSDLLAIASNDSGASDSCTDYLTSRKEGKNYGLLFKERSMKSSAIRNCL